MAPKSIGRFELISELGTHPLGLLYKANDPKRGHVALLVMEAAKLTPQSRQQVQQLFGRARTAALLNSPNIASVYGGGEADGYVFLSMEFVDGVTMRTAIARDGRMSTSDVIDTARQLCTALDHAQSKGVVHQNLHPGNIKVEWDGAVKLMDYGLDLPDKRKADDPALHYAMRYASPEQLRGEQLTSKSNLYTLGAVLYELVTGAKVITAEDSTAIRAQVLSGEILSASKVCSEVRQPINDAIMRALSSSPAERFESATALVRELENSNRPSIVKPKPVVPSSKPVISPGSPSRPKSTYGGPNTSAIFRAMNENFSHSRTAVAERPSALRDAELPPLAAGITPQTFASMPDTGSEIEIGSAIEAPLTPPRVEPAALKETVYCEPEAAASVPKSSVAQSIFDVVEKVEARVVEKAKEVAKEVAKEATKPKPAPHAQIKVEPKRHATKLVMPDKRTLSLVSAGMILAVGVLWGVSQLHSSAASTPQPQPIAQPVEQVEQPAPTTPESTAADDSQTVIVRHFKKKGTPAEVAAVPALGDIVVTSVPDGATIQVDGRTDAQWLTPQTISGLTPGEHLIHISKPGYTTVIKTVAVNAGERPVVSVGLQQVGAVLSVTSDPAGATIVIDGKDTGKLTPAQISVSAGPHQLALRKVGYFEFTTMAAVQNGQSMPVTGTLAQAGRTDQIQTVGNKFSKIFKGGGSAEGDKGRVRIKTRPKGAYIIVNGKPAPDATPSEFLLNAGTYEITLQLLGYRDLKRMITVESGKRIELDEVLEQR